MLSRKHLKQRLFLCGTGASIAPHYLDAMAPAFVAARRPESDSPKRLAFVYIPNGVIPQAWTPDSQDSEFEFTRTLKPLETHRRSVLVFSGLTPNNPKCHGVPGGRLNDSPIPSRCWCFRPPGKLARKRNERGADSAGSTRERAKARGTTQGAGSGGDAIGLADQAAAAGPRLKRSIDVSPGGLGYRMQDR